MSDEKLERELEEIRARLDAIPTSPSCDISFDQSYNEDKIKEFKAKIAESSVKYLNDLALKIVSVYILLKRKFEFSGGTFSIGDNYFVKLQRWNVDGSGNSLYWKIGIIEKLEEIKKKFKFFTYKVPFTKELPFIMIGCYAVYDGKRLTVKLFNGSTAIESLNMNTADFIIQHGEVLNFYLEEKITELTGEIAGENFEQLGNLEAQAYLLEGISRESVSMEIAKVKMPERKAEAKEERKARVVNALLNNLR
jgi:hypothetical protein